MKKLLSICLVFVLLLSALSFSGCKKRKTDLFNYATADLTQYVSLDLSEFVGKTLPLEGFSQIKREDALRVFLYQRMVSATYADAEVYDRKTGLGDYAFIYYDLTTTPGGQSVASNLFDSDPQRIMLGYWDFVMHEDWAELYPNENGLFYSQALSDALTDAMPAARKTEGAVSEGDVLRVSFTILKDGKEYIKESYMRVDTAYRSTYEATYGSAFMDALLSHEAGETFSIDGTFSFVNSVGDTISYSVTYKDVKILHVAEEDFQEVKIHLAEDAFDETYSDEFRALNGTTVYMNVCIDYFIDYNVPDLDAAYVINTLGFVPPAGIDVSDDEAVVEAAIEREMQILEESQSSEIRTYIIEYFYALLYSDSRIKKIPQEPLQKQTDYVVSYITSAYNKDRTAALSEGKSFPYADVNEYAAYYKEYSLSEYPTLDAYAYAVAVTNTRENLFYFAMAQLAGCRITPVELDRLCEEKLRMEQENYPDYTAEEIYEILYGSEEEFRWSVQWTCMMGVLGNYLYTQNKWIYDN